jgi:hypothetical protein
MATADPRVFNDRGEVIGNYLTPAEAAAMGLPWKPRPAEPAPYLTEDEARTAGVAYRPASSFAQYDYGSDAFRLAELRGLLAGRLAPDSVVIPPPDSALVRSMVASMPAAAVPFSSIGGAAPSPPTTTAATSLGGTNDFLWGAPVAPNAPLGFTTNGGPPGAMPIGGAASSGGLSPLVLVALAVAAYFLLVK